MASSTAYRGFIPVRKVGGNYNTNAVTDNIVLADTSASDTAPSNNIYTGDPVVMPGAQGATITTSVCTTLKISGVFMGCQYVTGGEQKFSRYWPGGTSATDVKFFVITDPNQTYHIQGDATISVSQLIRPYNYDISVSASGNTTTGQSGYFLDSSSKTEAISPVRVIGRSHDPNEGEDDQYPVVEVYISNHRDRYVTASVSTTA